MSEVLKARESPKTKPCAKCGRPIPAVRLVALPDTTRCVGCSCERCRDVLSVELDGPDMGDLARSVQAVQT